MKNIILSNSGRVVKDTKFVYVYLCDPPIIPNVTSIDNYLGATATSGSLLFTSYPQGIDILNRYTGCVAEYDLTTSGYSIKPALSRESNLQRIGIAISGSKLGGRI
jgi:hypothetical protein